MPIQFPHDADQKTPDASPLGPLLHKCASRLSDGAMLSPDCIRVHTWNTHYKGSFDGTEVARRGPSQFIMNGIVCLQIE
jgi:hypothetical protein